MPGPRRRRCTDAGAVRYDMGRQRDGDGVVVRVSLVWTLRRSPDGTRRAWRQREELQVIQRGEYGPRWWEIAPAFAALLLALALPLFAVGWAWSGGPERLPPGPASTSSARWFAANRQSRPATGAGRCASRSTRSTRRTAAPSAGSSAGSWSGIAGRPRGCWSTTVAPCTWWVMARRPAHGLCLRARH